MTHSRPIRRALVSVSDKSDLIAFVRGLLEFGIEVISTGGTARALGEAGIDVIPVDEVTHFPEMMDGRVKTLHPAIHGALLGRRDVESHTQAMAAHGIRPIDLVCVNLYPFEQTIAGAGVTRAEAIEQIDIGGPALLRSSAKNHESVTVVTSPTQYDRVIAEMRARSGATSEELRIDLAATAFMRTAAYDTAIGAWMSARRGQPFPALLRLVYAHRRDLRYGENPHQRAALYADTASTEPSVVSAEMLHGKPLSYNNINDAARALTLVRDLHRTHPAQAAATILKHTNPCGAAVADDLATAFEKAYEGDALAAYGGILAVSRTLDEACAERICDGDRFLEVIVAPAYEAAASTRLGARWKNVRLLAVPDLVATDRRELEYRSIPGGLLVQDRDRALSSATDWTHAAGPEPTEAMWHDAVVLWTVCKHLTSNAVAIGSGGQLLGAGAGQMDRLSACRIAIEKTNGRGAGAALIAASDAFFPFSDGPQLLIDAGVRCIVHPGGSKRDRETLDLCEQHGVTCLLTGVRHFRH